jgi:hypothetical protein
MGRFVLAGFVSCMALCLAATAVGAEDEKGELERLRQENQGLKAAQLEQDITAYLAETKAWQGAEGGDSLKGVSLKAAFTAVTQGTLGQGNGADDMVVAGGNFDLNFDLQVSDDVSLFIDMTANTAGASTNGFGAYFPGNFPVDGIAIPVTPFGAATAAGFTDGIDVNGTVPTNPGSVQTNEVGVRVATHLGNTVLNWEMGELDPRRRFLQNAFVPDNHTTFIHNSFNDPASVQWITTSAGVGSLGWYMWIEFGNQKQFTLSWGWFNLPGQFWMKGQFYVQFGWKAEVSGREMNLKFLLHSDYYNGNTGPGPGSGIANEESNILIGWSWDWWVSEKIGLFFTGGFNVDDNNPVDYDFAFGVIFAGLIQSRPDDQFGAGFVFTHLDEDVVTVPEDTEFTFEIYYRLAIANGKVLVTPHMLFVMDPGGGQIVDGGTFSDDTLFILGIRIYVPF